MGRPPVDVAAGCCSPTEAASRANNGGLRNVMFQAVPHGVVSLSGNISNIHSTNASADSSGCFACCCLLIVIPCSREPRGCASVLQRVTSQIKSFVRLHGGSRLPVSGRKVLALKPLIGRWWSRIFHSRMTCYLRGNGTGRAKKTATGISVAARMTPPKSRLTDSARPRIGRLGNQRLSGPSAGPRSQIGRQPQPYFEIIRIIVDNACPAGYSNVTRKLGLDYERPPNCAGARRPCP